LVTLPDKRSVGEEMMVLQRSEFYALLRNAGVVTLIAKLRRKTVDRSGCARSRPGENAASGDP